MIPKMIKYILLILFMSGNVCFGQEQKHRKVDIELGAGITFGAVKYSGYSSGIGPSMKLEGRYNFENKPIDVGLQIARWGIIRNDDPSNKDIITNDVNSFLLVGDYQFQKGKRVNPYAGLGVGIIGSDWSSSIYTCVAPRIGVRFFNHLNLHLDYKIANRADRHASLCLGFYF